MPRFYSIAINCRFSSSVGYYGISLNISSLAGNKYFNFFISALLELIAYIMTVFVTERYSIFSPYVFVLKISTIFCGTNQCICKVLTICKRGWNFNNLVTRFGRRKSLCVYLMVGAVTSIVAGVLSEKAGWSDFNFLKFYFVWNICYLPFTSFTLYSFINPKLFSLEVKWKAYPIDPVVLLGKA